MDADYSFYVKFIATRAHTFFGYIISVFASVDSLDSIKNVNAMTRILLLMLIRFIFAHCIPKGLLSHKVDQCNAVFNLET